MLFFVAAGFPSDSSRITENVKPILPDRRFGGDRAWKKRLKNYFKQENEGHINVTVYCSGKIFCNKLAHRKWMGY